MVINSGAAAEKAAALVASSGRLRGLQLASRSSGTASLAADVANLHLSTTLEQQRFSINQLSTQLSNAISFTQTQGGYLEQVKDALQRMNKVSDKAKDESLTDSQREGLNQEFQDLAQYVQGIAGKDFNGVSLFSGKAQFATDSQTASMVAVAEINLAQGAYEPLNSGLDLKTAQGAAAAASVVQNALTQVGTDLKSLGSTMKTLSDNQLRVVDRMMAGGQNQITDASEADAALSFSRNQIITQSNLMSLFLPVMPSGVYSLLR